MGRPQIPIDELRVEKLAALGASVEEIAAELAPIGKKSLNPKTIRRRFGPTLKKGAQIRNLRLRSALIREALKGNAPVLIFACKVLLGMKEPRDDAFAVNVQTTVLSRIQLAEIEAEARPVRETVAGMFEKYRPPATGDGNGQKAIDDK
jgi:hypothetical protein